MTQATLRMAELDGRGVDRALREHGGFVLEGAPAALLAPALVEQAQAFFALPRAAKQALAIERSPHFRGWSELHNVRDWREQLHFGRELAHAARGAVYDALEGPNLWPESSAFRAALLAYFSHVAELGDVLLRHVARGLGLPDHACGATARDGYALLKLIAYHPQPASDEAPRSGVAAHVDFSWLTATWQDDPGLEICTPQGEWRLVPPRPDTLWVHTGEILQHATRGRYPATPHRVMNRSQKRTRVSMPFFVNPPLAALAPVFDASGPAPAESHGARALAPHVHRVLGREGPFVPFCFGEAEWRRKGENRWCSECTEPTSRPE